MMKKSFTIIVIGILLSVLIIFVMGCKGGNKEPKKAPVAAVKPLPDKTAAIPVIQDAVRVDYAKDIKTDLNSILDTS